MELQVEGLFHVCSLASCWNVFLPPSYLLSLLPRTSCKEILQLKNAKHHL